MSADTNGKYSIEDAVRQSPPLDFSSPFDEAWVKGKTIVITGGASGFGEGFFRRWAAAGANVIIGDISVEKGDKLVRDVSRDTGNKALHFLHCDVTDWQSQVEFFKSAVKFSLHGGIDCVVANAGVVEKKRIYGLPKGLDEANPPPPPLDVVDVNLTGVLYTTHLALFWLAKNPDSVPASPKPDKENQRDRHLLLLSSMAGLAPLPTDLLYTVSKHGVVGLFRSLRGTSFLHGVRVNMLCPYFVETPLVDTVGRILLAGVPKGKIEDVVDTATRFVADPAIVGRTAMVGPRFKMKEDGSGELIPTDEPGVQERAAVEVYAHDFEEADIFTSRMVSLLHRVMEVRGWAAYIGDLYAALRYRLGI